MDDTQKPTNPASEDISTDTQEVIAVTESEEVVVAMTESEEGDEVIEAAEQQIEEPEEEIRAEEASTGTASTAEDIVRLDQLIKGYLTDIDNAKDKLKTHKEMLAGAFENDKTYQELDQEVRELNKKKADIKQKIMSQAANMQVKEEMIDLQEQMKEVQQAVSDYLKKYQELTGATEFETADGQVRQIVSLVKLVKKK